MDRRSSLVRLLRRGAEAAVVVGPSTSRGIEGPSTSTAAHPTERTPLLRPVGSHASLRSARQHAQYETAHTASIRKTFMLLIKSFIGTGVLFLPRAFYNGGLGFSIGFLIIVALLNYYGMLLIVQCTFKIPGSFGDLGGVLYGPKMKTAVQLSIAMSQVSTRSCQLHHSKGVSFPGRAFLMLRCTTIRWAFVWRISSLSPRTSQI